MEKQSFEFAVLKKSFTFSTCSACEGTGVKKNPFRKMVWVTDCPVCSGSGRQRHTKTEEVPLLDVLLDEAFIEALKQKLSINK